MELYAAAGIDIVHRLGSLGKRVFLDLKLYDIGETVKRATRRICQNDAVTFMTVHGSRSVIMAAIEGRQEAGADGRTKLLAVTVLTSLDQQDVRDEGYTLTLSELIALRAQTALENGIDGVICSPRDAGRVREIVGPKMLIVTPGVRSQGAATGDQKRVATPSEAIQAGADYLVIGRQVTRASDPRTAYEQILTETGAVARDVSLASRN